jgi:hypothetical protein
MNANMNIGINNSNNQMEMSFDGSRPCPGLRQRNRGRPGRGLFRRLCGIVRDAAHGGSGSASMPRPEQILLLNSQEIALTKI